jgi:hypothetical protein
MATISYLPEGVLSKIEPDLAELSEDLGLPYIRPELSAKGRFLIIDSPLHFCKAYVTELQKVVRDNFGYVQV